MLASELRYALTGFPGVFRTEVAMAPMTHVRIGGAAEFLLEPHSEEGVAQVVRLAARFEQPLHILGNGSNVLIPTEGLRGMVLSLGQLNRVMRDDDRITAGAGVTLPSLIRGTKDLGLAGLELLIGVPAVVGGAVAMNAGTHDTEVFEHLVSIVAVNSEGELEIIGKDGMSPSYRNGGLGDRIVVGATFELRQDEPQEIFQRMEVSLKRRNATQPVTEMCVGCVFKNPPGDAAGRLIEAAGCKTLRRGEVVVSGKHANYFINEGGATSQDFLDLVRDVQDRVREEFAVELKPEVRIWGV